MFGIQINYAGSVYTNYARPFGPQRWRRLRYLSAECIADRRHRRLQAASRRMAFRRRVVALEVPW